MPITAKIPLLSIAFGGVAIFLLALELTRAIMRTKESLTSAAAAASSGDHIAAAAGGILPEDRLRIKIILAVIILGGFGTMALFQVSNLARFPVAGSLLGALLLVAGLYAAFVLVDKVFQFIYERRLEKMNRQLIDAMNVLSLALRSGRTFESALPIVAHQIPYPLSDEFDRMVQEINVGGVPLDQALRRLAERLPFKDMQIFVSTALIVQTIGGSQADILDKNSQLIRERFRIKQKIQSVTAEGRFSAFSISLAPAFVLLVNFLIDPVTVTAFVTNPIGMLILTAIAVSDYVGYLILSNLVRIEF